MKTSALGGIAVFLAGTLAGFAQSPGLGINFASTDPDATTSSLFPEELAGVVPQANWNNLTGASGTDVTGLVYDNSGTAIASTVTLSWTSPNTWRSGANSTFFGPDQKLLSGYLDTGNTAATGISITVNGLDDAVVAEGYDVYVYFVSDSAANRGGAYILDPGTGPVVKYGSTMGTPFEYVQDPGTDADLTQDGNYLKFTGLTGSSFTLITDTTLTTPNGFRAPINAIQIVPTVPFGPEFPAQTGNVRVYAGQTATFSATVEGFPAITSLQWQKDGEDVEDDERISGANSTVLTIQNVAAEDAGSYTLVATSPRGTDSSAPAVLSISMPDGSDYEAAVINAGPLAFYRLNEEAVTSDVFDYVGGRTGTYEELVQRGSAIAGPRPPPQPGFSSANSSAAFDTFTYATVPTPPLNVDTATFILWINPTWSQLDFTGLLMSRGATASGLGYTTDNQLGYTWNNNSTWSWNSGLRPPDGEWSMVALVVEPTKATLYMGASGTLNAAINPIAHIAEAWGGLARIGDDQGGASRGFSGSIDEVAIFNRALTFQEVADLYEEATGIPQVIPPTISPQPQSTTRYAGANVQFQSGAAGADFELRWWKGASELSDDDRISGSETDTLTINNITEADAGNYTLVASNSAGSNTSEIATLVVLEPSNSYVSQVISHAPLSYYRLNETGDVSMGTLPASDFWGGRNGVWGASSLNNMEGPAPSSGYDNFETSNTALQTSVSLTDSWATVPGPEITTDTITMVAWIKPTTLVANAGIVFARAGQPATGLNLSGTGNIGYHWLDAAATYNFASNLTPPLNEWSMVAVVVEPTRASLHMLNSSGLQTAVNTTTHAARMFTDNIRIGGDPNNANRTFDGVIDEVAIFGTALTPTQIQSLYVSALGDVAPTIGSHPASQERFPGVTVQFTVGAIGSEPMDFRWQVEAGGTFGDLEDDDWITGSGTPTLTITDLPAELAGVYRVRVSNAQGEAISEPATLTVLEAPPQPDAGTFGAAVLAGGASAYWRLNETGDPFSGSLQAYDHAGVLHGLYGVASLNGFHSINGPRPSDGFPQFEAANFGIFPQASIADSWVTVPGPGFTTDTLTLLAWINPFTLVNSSGIVFARAGLPATGINLTGTGNLGYHWLDTATTYNWDSTITPPTGQWSLVALVVEPDQATLYLVNSAGTQSNMNVVTHAPRAFTDNIRIGGDPNNVARTFDGSIDEVAIFNRALSAAEIAAIYAGEEVSTPPVLNITEANGQITITWDQSGTLQAAAVLEGEETAWEDVPTTGNSHMLPADAPAMYFRVAP